MPSLADLQREIDAEIFADLGELMLVRSAEVPGVFFNRPREVGTTDGTFVGVDLSFDCQINDTVRNLQRGDEVKIVAKNDAGEQRALGTYAFHRRVPEQGDESGLVTCELHHP